MPLLCPSAPDTIWFATLPLAWAVPVLAISGPLASRATCGETAARVCYGVDGGTAQNIGPVDIDPLWTMPPKFGSSECTIPVDGAGTVLVLAKHINPRTNSSVTYYDLARTIDGGVDTTPEQRAASLLGACGGNGGMKGVTVDTSDPTYSSPAYVSSKAKPQDIIVKLVRAPSS
ncbi:hypothetical protein N657DRAFT_658062 [Parathielavia appendiculata]|uniref:Secreted protein n=1 Tax=Parathielavia appendiculata TaxID=2587402 RepID=A0AAN6TUR7_9PEZI|nr:hypothetical protein N657DRAFT_658062 [Parathielavia appendiculata]